MISSAIPAHPENLSRAPVLAFQRNPPAPVNLAVVDSFSIFEADPAIAIGAIVAGVLGAGARLEALEVQERVVKWRGESALPMICSVKKCLGIWDCAIKFWWLQV